MVKILFRIAVLSLSLILLSACGGGGGGGVQISTPTTAVITLSTTGMLSSGTKIGGIAVAVVLPAGVTVNAVPDAQNSSILVTTDGVVTASGVTGPKASALATYSPSDRKIAIQVYDQDGFFTGDFVTVRCNISGAAPAAGDFSLSNFEVKDLNGAAISGLTIGLTVSLY